MCPNAQGKLNASVTVESQVVMPALTARVHAEKCGSVVERLLPCPRPWVHPQHCPPPPYAHPQRGLFRQLRCAHILEGTPTSLGGALPHIRALAQPIATVPQTHAYVTALASIGSCSSNKCVSKPKSGRVKIPGNRDFQLHWDLIRPQGIGGLSQTKMSQHIATQEEQIC